MTFAPGVIELAAVAAKAALPLLTSDTVSNVFKEMVDRYRIAQKEYTITLAHEPVSPLASKKEHLIAIISIPFAIVMWSFIGSLSAMLYRFNKSDDAELADPLRWMFTRPLTGVVMGVVSFLILKAGLTTIGSTTIDPANLGKQEFMW